MAGLSMYPERWRTGDRGVAPLPYRAPGALPLPAWLDREAWPELARPELLSGLYRCQRCGMCRHTPACRVREELGERELSSPRARLAVLRGLLEERLGWAEVPEEVARALAACRLCGRCDAVCIVNVAFREGKSPEKNIDHAALFRAFRALLRRRGSGVAAGQEPEREEI